MINQDRVVNALLIEAMVRQLSKEYEFDWYRALFLVHDWIASNIPEKLPILRGEMVPDYFNHWSKQMEEIFSGVAFVAETLRREREEGLSFSPRTIDTHLNNALGIDAETFYDAGHGPRETQDDIVDVEKFIQKLAIDKYRLPLFVECLEVFAKAMEGWDNRRYLVINSMMKRDFERMRNVLSSEEQNAMAVAIIRLCKKRYGETDKKFYASDWTHIIRFWLAPERASLAAI